MRTILTVYLKPYSLRMAAGFAIKFVGSVMDLCIPWILAHIIDVVIPMGGREAIFGWGLGMVGCSVVAVTFNIIANRMAAQVASRTTLALRRDLFSRTLSLSSAQTDAFTKPSLISRLTTDTYNVNQMVSRVQRLGVRAPILLLGGIIFTMAMEPALSAVLLCVMPFLAAVMVLVSKKSLPLYRRLQEEMDRLVCLVREDIAGIRVIKALSRTGYESERFRGVNGSVVSSERRAEQTMATLDPATGFLLNMGLVGVILVGAVRVNAGESEVGKILAFMTYFTIILNAMMSISRMFVMISKAMASAGRIDQVLRAPEDPPRLDEVRAPEDLPRQDDAGAPEAQGREEQGIRFENVTFSYHKKEPDLENISFFVPRGTMLGVIGSTGSGKTTLAALLMRLMDPDRGRVLIDGRDVRSYDDRTLRGKFGVAFQNDTIFEDTIDENVRMGRPLSQEALEKAFLCAQAEEFAQEKRDAEGSRLEIRGANLSGGQKQRVLIARALAGNPEILVLDDSSSALDYRTDARLRKMLRECYPDTTVVMIAQRVSSVMRTDRILVLEEGRAIGYGTHEDLMRDCPAYREIAESQTGAGPLREGQ